MANFYKYTKDGTKIATYSANRNGDISFLGEAYFLVGVVTQGIYLYRLEGATLTQKNKVIDFSSGTYSLNQCLGVAFDGKYICSMSEKTSLPSEMYIERYTITGERVATYRLTDDNVRDGLAWDGKFFYTWDRTANKDELDKIYCSGSTGNVVGSVSGGFNALTSIEHDGKSFWTTLNAAGAGYPVANIDQQSNILQSWSHGSSNMQGICSDKKYIYVLSN